MAFVAFFGLAYGFTLFNSSVNPAEILDRSFGFSPDVEYYRFMQEGFSKAPIELFLVSNLAVIRRFGDAEIRWKSSSLSLVLISFLAIGFCGSSLAFIGDSTEFVDMT